MPRNLILGTAGHIDHGKKGQADRAVTIPRWTVIVGLDGNVAAIYPVSDAAGDAKKVEGIVNKLEKK